ncbi:serine/threonine-protein kinase TAO3-like [Malurus melanocephalus]|uniref:serine/threonine-protein kinase TAO3-like n=1 Tax=Malurus melanocephalus TaxID=175006 RepID=UPI0025494618|nr:serine/threonine-protein kinase TAO3-like [Malurus melanocephalus]
MVREVQLLQRLRHPNTVGFLGCFLRDHTAWLVMEFCAGSALDLLEVHQEPLNEDEIGAIAEGALRGLSFIHGLGVIHRWGCPIDHPCPIDPKIPKICPIDPKSAP